jgi:hypothetical protein
MVDEIDYIVLMPWNLFIEEFRNTYVGGVAPMLQYPFLESYNMDKNVTCCSTWVPSILILIPLDSIDKVLILASYSIVTPLATMCFSKN